ncbi:MAG TPA: PPOX class F420-dependent oxidoreductase [Pseudonocardiaceae bacterium]|nr:PPOX class F420-dependent oxidoreductase [Pseudonocardiaceae bacterium]
MVFTQDELDYLGDQRLGRLATQAPDGTLQVSPVGFSFNAERGTIDIVGYNMTKSKKYRNVRDNGRAAIVVDDILSVSPWRVRCLEIRGSGEVDGELIRITPRHIISFGLAKGDADVEPHQLRANIRDVD